MDAKSYFEATPPADRWAVFHGISRVWGLTPQQQLELLETQCIQPATAPTPPGVVAERMEMLKDIALYLHFREGYPPEPAADWLRQPRGVFNNNSALQVMTLPRMQVPLSAVWHMHDNVVADHPGLALVRRVAGLASCAGDATPAARRAAHADLVKKGRSSAAPQKPLQRILSHLGLGA